MRLISYLGEVPTQIKPTVVFMQDMAQLWLKWPCAMEDVNKWKWGVNLSHHKAADRKQVLACALCDVCGYERDVHGVEPGVEPGVNGPEWQSIIEHILHEATFVCHKDGQPVNVDV